ncbi:hypothetical protein FACS1894159_05370 [Bacteroidia bacterium]|nr:hypothetical protein FACS1894159_05370 [Bacteroidia bacterium]
MLNKVILIGNVGADPEVRSLEGGVKVARIRLATTERSYNRETKEAKEFTEWHNVTLWRNLADVADRFVRKGSQIYIEGGIRSREWTDDAGNKRYGIEIVANEMKLLGRRPDSAGQSGQQQSYGQGTQAQQTAPGAQGAGQYAAQPGGQYAQSQPAAASTQPSAAETQLDDPDDLPF